MTPGQVIDQLSDYARDGAAATIVQNLKNQSLNNPLPLLMMGASFAWLMLGKEGPLAQTAAMAAAESRIPYLQLLTTRTFIGCCAATFGAYWALSLGLTWFTSFIVTGLGFSQTAAGWISTLPWMFGAVVVIRRRSRAAFFVLLTAIALATQPILLYGDPRYRVPAEPFFAILAADCRRPNRSGYCK